MPSLNSTDLLKIPSENGSPVNEYRIHDGQIEFRALDPMGNPLPKYARGWRILTAADLQFHFALNTVVAKWLMQRLGGVPGNSS